MLKLIVRTQDTLHRLLHEDDGNAAEYGLIIAVVAVVIVAGLGLLAAALNGLFGNVADTLNTPRG